MHKLLVRFIADDQGQDLIEYGLLVGIITIALITAVTTVSENLVELYNKFAERIGGFGEGGGGGS